MSKSFPSYERFLNQRYELAAPTRLKHQKVIATLAYLIERQQNAAAARAVITDLLMWAQVVSTSHSDALTALQLNMPDFEDAMQASAAMACGANYIITRNVRDFKTSPVPALTPEAFQALETSKKHAERRSIKHRSKHPQTPCARHFRAISWAAFQCFTR